MSGLTHHQGRRIAAVIAAVAVTMLSMIVPHTRALAETDVLQQAINYLFTGEIDPEDAPAITDRTSCVVVVADRQYNRSTRYYLSRFRMDPPRFETRYSGRIPNYTLVVDGDDDVIEFLNPDMTVAHGHRTARIPLAGDRDQTERALRVISDRCKARKPKPLF